jgi:hypothetical protein
MEKLMWEGIEWTMIGRWSSKYRTMKCDGCENETPAILRFSAVAPSGETLEAKWCFECVEIVRAPKVSG